ncbi:biotin--[acetyl-CoA-carboxylase] ligase [Paenisporosarcina sp.]|uniref:biotin--[acetyl-CoA-carboxylase] ligase n=1 Tax=Paenisporosarcina sp. TaxID=1932001 RepID=UPI003C75CC13
MNPTVKYEITKRLLTANGQPLSGQQLADDFGLSRTAIWKHIKELEEEGYEIETIKKKGYVLSSSPDSLLAAKINQYLTTKRFGHTIQYEVSCPSTQPIAHQMAQSGAPDGSIVVCEEQTAGKGRMARVWTSTQGKGIWMSVIIRPEIPPTKAPQFTLVAAVAVTRAIEDIADVRAEIKWPNDLLINGKKCTGILTELQADMDRVHAIILGIGVNVNQQLTDFPDEIQSIATSIQMVTGKIVDRAKLVARILHHLEIYTDLYVMHGFEPLKILWESYSCTLGKRIKAIMIHQQIEGLALGITSDGILQVKTDDGQIHGIYSADIEIQN